MIAKARRETIVAALGYAPGPVHGALLAAALAPDDAACRHAWERWRALTATRGAQRPDTRRLLGAAFPKVARAVPGDPELPRLRGIHRRALYWHHLMAHRAGGVLDALAARAIPTLLLKGAALTARYRIDPGSRPMGDVDIAVPRARALEALAVLDGLAAWHTSTPGSHTEHLAHLHARDYQDADGFGVDLHWRVLLDAPDADGPLWQSAEPATWLGREVLVLGASDQLFHTLVQDAAQTWRPSPHGLLDAAIVLGRDGGRIDWPRLVDIATKVHQVLPLLAGLRALAGLGLAVPPDVLVALERAPVSRADAWYYELRMRSGAWTPLRVLATYWFRRGRSRGPLRAALELPEYLRALERAPDNAALGAAIWRWARGA